MLSNLIIKSFIFFSILYHYSISSGAILIYYYWEAMLVTYLSSRVTSLPFSSMQGLLNSPYSLYTEPGSSFWDSFKFGNPLWRNIFEKKLEPFEDDYNGFMVNNDNPWTGFLQQGDRAVYVAHFSLEYNFRYKYIHQP